MHLNLLKITGFTEFDINVHFFFRENGQLHSKFLIELWIMVISI